MTTFGVGVSTLLIERLKFHVFPVRRVLFAGTEQVKCDCDDEDCVNAGKHPRVAWSKEKPTPAMWEKYPDDGFGIATGHRSNIWVLDVDPKNGGFESLQALEAKYGPLPKTLSVVTGSGGAHYYFTYPGPDFRNTAHILGPGLDTRGDGGYVVGPGSLHKSGQRYRWMVGPDDSPVVAPPAWLLDLTRRESRGAVGSNGPGGGGAEGVGRDRVLATAEVMKERHWMIRWMTSECAVGLWMREFPEEVSREVWRGVATNLAAVTLALQGGGVTELQEAARQAFHYLSEPYSKYKARETDRVFDDSLSVAGTYGPISYEWMMQCGLPPEHVEPQDAKNMAHGARIMWRESQANKFERTRSRQK